VKTQNFKEIGQPIGPIVVVESNPDIGYETITES